MLNRQPRYWPREAKENRSITYDTFGKWSSLECCQTQVSYFHRSSWSSNKNIITFQVSVNYWRSSCVQEKKTLQDLPTPTPQHFRFHHFKSLQIPRAQHTHKWVLRKWKHFIRDLRSFNSWNSIMDKSPLSDATRAAQKYPKKIFWKEELEHSVLGRMIISIFGANTTKYFEV